MNSKTILLGDAEYTITELPARKNSAWRKELEAKLEPVMALLKKAGEGLEIRTSDDLMMVVNEVGRLMVAAPDLMIELLFSYSPDLAVSRETILDTAYDSELTRAFVAVLGLAYPFGGLVGQLQNLSALAGSPTTPMMTSTSLPSVNGVPSVKSSTN